MKKLFFAILLALACSAPLRADQLRIIRAPQSYPEAMLTLQGAISSRGYKITRVQNIDVGISKTGHTIDYYKVVFYGNLEETAQLTRKHPQLIPYLPLNIVIFAEDSNTVVTAARPAVLAEFFPDPELKPVFEHWEKDLLAILDEVREAK